MPLQVQAPARLRLQQNQLEVSLATTFAEIDAALRLRFEVFNLELREGLSASYERGYDRDAYDAWCDKRRQRLRTVSPPTRIPSPTGEISHGSPR